MECEILEQRELLAMNADAYLQQWQSFSIGTNFELVLFVARGSSDNAALFGRYLVESALGIPVSLAAPSVVTKQEKSIRYPPCLCIGISQSGSAGDVISVLQSVKAQGHKTVAITNDRGSEIAIVADHVLDLRAGEERALPATKTYSSTLLALHQFVALQRGSEVHLKLPTVEWMQSTNSFAQQTVETICNANVLFALGRSFRFASAQEAGLKLMECALLPCIGYSWADFLHGPRALADRNARVLSFGEPEIELPIETVVRFPEPSVAQEVAPIWDAVALQWLALFAGRHRGIDSDAPPYLNKVTRTL